MGIPAPRSRDDDADENIGNSTVPTAEDSTKTSHRRASPSKSVSVETFQAKSESGGSRKRQKISNGLVVGILPPETIRVRSSNNAATDSQWKGEEQDFISLNAVVAADDETKEDKLPEDHHVKTPPSSGWIPRNQLFWWSDP